jgi:hypothetical protein
VATGPVSVVSAVGGEGDGVVCGDSGPGSGGKFCDSVNVFALSGVCNRDHIVHGGSRSIGRGRCCPNCCSR